MQAAVMFPIRGDLQHPATSRLRRLMRVVTAWLMLAALLGADGPEPATTDKGPKARSLFDGKTLDGWKQADLFGSAEVVVEDGAIQLPVSERMSGMTGVTSTRQDLPTTDYELTYEAKRTSGRDFFAAATFPVGKAFITLVNGGWGGNVTGLSSLDGSDASENETSRYIPYENDTWYTFRVQVTGRRIRGLLNGEEIINVKHEGRHVGTRLETSASKPLGFATWETGGAIRNIAVRPLSPEEIAEIHANDD